MSRSSPSAFRNAAILLVAAWMGLFFLVPNLLVLAVSFLSRHETGLVASPLTLENYLRLLDPVYGEALLRSTGLAAAATALCLALGYPFAYLLSRTRAGTQRTLLVLLIIPYWTNSLIRTYSIRSLLAANGPVNALLAWTGATGEPFPFLYNAPAVVLGLVYLLLPFMVLPLYAVLEKLDPALLEAAGDLGAGRMQRLLRIVLPLTLPGIIAGSLLVFLPALGMFFVADLLGGSRDLLVGNFIKGQFLEARNWPFGSATSVALTLIMGALLVAYHYSVRWTKREAI
jgi:spermidine/putrescine transport system permease protein